MLNLDALHDIQIQPMHLRRKTTRVAPRTRITGGTSMAVDALRILAVGAHATGRQPGDVAQRVELRGRRLRVVCVGAVGSVRAVAAQVVYVAHLQRLDALDVEAVVLDLRVDALAEAVARDGAGVVRAAGAVVGVAADGLERLRGRGRGGDGRGPG